MICRWIGISEDADEKINELERDNEEFAKTLEELEQGLGERKRRELANKRNESKRERRREKKEAQSDAQATGGSFTEARKTTREGKISQVVSLIKSLLGVHYDKDNEKKALLYSLASSMGIKTRMTPSEDSHFCAVFRISGNQRAQFKKFLKQDFHMTDIFSSNKLYTEFRKQISVSKDYKIEITVRARAKGIKV